MRKKIMLLMCMAALLVAFFSLGVVGANPESPDVTVVAARVDNGTALELGVRIDSKNDSFQSTGIVLQYDASALTPCGWADEVTDALLEKARVNPANFAEGETLWDHAVPLPTKGKDIISGKTAFTVIDTSTTPHTGYLYLNVEAPAPTYDAVQAPAPLYGLNQVKPSEMGLEGLVELTDPTPANFGYKSNHGLLDATSAVDQVITVRFALPEESEPEEPEQPVDPTPDPEPNPDENEPSGQADETGDGSGEGGGTTEPEPTDPTEPDPENPENPDDPPAETVDDYMATYGIAVAGDATAVNMSPAGCSGVYYYNTDTEPVEISNWHFLSVKNGISVNQGSGGPPDPSDFAALVFYDWDETLLGAIIVPKGDATKYVDDFTNARIADPSELDSKYLWYSNEKIAADEADPEKTPKYLSNKKAYDFDAWLLNDSDTFTAQDEALPKYDGTNDAAAAEKGVANFTNVSGDMIVKASYKANETINKLDNGRTSPQYSITEPIYNRYAAAAATTGDYSLRVTVTRENADGYGVTRLREPGFRAKATPDVQGAALVNILNSIENKDTAEVELAMPKMVRQVQYTLIETYAYPNWPAAGQKSPNITKKKNTGTVTADKIGTDGFVKEGTLTFINEQCIKYIQEGTNTGWTAQTNAVAFLDAGLTEPIGSTITAAVATQNRAKIEAAIRANGLKPLTYAELRSVLGLPAVP